MLEPWVNTAVRLYLHKDNHDDKYGYKRLNRGPIWGILMIVIDAAKQIFGYQRGVADMQFLNK